jgi:ubiquinone/menaquinone biosynthesis C-methylase UbiE
MKISIKNQENSERSHFDKMAVNYDANYGYNNDFFNYKKEKKLLPLANLLSKSKDSNLKILEIGCGTGEYTTNLAKIFPKSNISGLDISSGILSIAKKKCRRYRKVKFIVGSAYSLPFRAKSFDVVCGFYILHHLDLKRVMDEVGKVLKPGGIAYFVEPNLLNPVVFIIKSIPILKKRAGDSPTETAINPISFSKVLPYKLILNSIAYTEYIFPLSSISFKTMKRIDKFFSLFSLLPVFKLFGGTVLLQMSKIK